MPPSDPTAVYQLRIRLDRISPMIWRRLMDAEVQALIGADRYQHSDERTTYRNGHREREWQTRVGE